MKIGIITKYYKNYNFGGLLQSYALVKKLEEMGHVAYQISFLPNEIKKYGIVTSMKNSIHLIIRNCVIRIKSRNISSLNKKMKKFMLEIKHTPPIKEKNLNRLTASFDIFIAGSDQIWNPAFAYDAYFLDFVDTDKRKISYAASFGIENFSDKEVLYIKNFVSKFDFVSVREKTGYFFLKSIIPNKNIEWVLDPVFLLSKTQWLEVCDSVCLNTPDNYAAVYLMGNNKENETLINNIIETMNLKKIVIPFTIDDFNYKNLIDKDMGPREFLTIIKNANVVFTDSFHATSFSIIFGVNFYCLNRNKNKDVKSMNSRMDALFNMLDIKPRWIENYDDFMSIGSFENFESVNKKISYYRESSVNYLRCAIDRKE